MSQVVLDKIERRNAGNPRIKRRLMTPLQAFFAIIKGYTTMNIFMLPIGFKQGGWLFSPIMLLISAVFEATCAIKLAEAAN